jgi:hypothetical protein
MPQIVFKYAIGTQVIVNPKSGPMGGHEFTARIDRYRDGNYVVVDQDNDAFEVGEDEITPESK